MLRSAAKCLTQFGFLGLLLLPATFAGCSSSGTSTPAGTGGTSGGGGGKGGSIGPGTCTVSSNPVSSCATPTKPGAPLLSDFSPASYMSTPKKWGVCGNLLGAAQAYSGKMTSAAGVVTAMTASVDTTTEKLTMVGKVADGDYAGGIMAFSTCADLTAYSGFQFALGGTLSGCDLQFQLQTLSQQSSENSGGCVANADTGVSCYNFPKLSVTFDAAAPTVVHFADLVGTGMPSAVADFSKEIIGIQWQVQAGSGDCAAVNLTIDDVKLVTN